MSFYRVNAAGDDVEIIRDPQRVTGTDVEAINMSYVVNPDGNDGELFYSRAPITDTFNASGTWTKRPGIVRVVVKMQHGGGGGAPGGANGLLGSRGSGGGGGASAIHDIQASTLPESVSVSVAAGGLKGELIGNVRHHGTDGGVCSFGMITSGGGGEGGRATSGFNYTADGGVAGTGGHRGGNGLGIGSANQGGHGGGVASFTADGEDATSTEAGGNGGTAMSFAAGEDGGVPGGGAAGGGTSGPPVTPRDGGDGGHGRVIVESWYY